MVCGCEDLGEANVDIIMCIYRKYKQSCCNEYVNNFHWLNSRLFIIALEKELVLQTKTHYQIYQSF